MTNTTTSNNTRNAYAELATSMHDDIIFISDKSQPKYLQYCAVKHLKQALEDCLWDKRLDHLTVIYRHTEPNTDVNVGYDQKAVSIFVNEMMVAYT